jgi:hypothetical protein
LGVFVPSSLVVFEISMRSLIGGAIPRVVFLIFSIFLDEDLKGFFFPRGIEIWAYIWSKDQKVDLVWTWFIRAIVVS